jgi:hypothetical protein
MKKRSGRNVTWSQQKEAMIDAGWEMQSSNPKHRYVYVLDKSDKRLIDYVESLRQPYPKRAAEVTPGDTLGVQQRKGGSRPTQPLQIE